MVSLSNQERPFDRLRANGRRPILGMKLNRFVWIITSETILSNLDSRISARRQLLGQRGAHSFKRCKLLVAGQVVVKGGDGDSLVP